MEKSDLEMNTHPHPPVCHAAALILRDQMGSVWIKTGPKNQNSFLPMTKQLKEKVKN